MSKFGYWYPPGAANDPNAPYNQDDPPCDICGQEIENCICPECSVCGQIGERQCYGELPGAETHGLVRSGWQLALKEAAEADWEAEARAEAQAEAEYLEQRNHYSKIADRIDGYDRDDLGESPDY